MTRRTSAQKSFRRFFADRSRVDRIGRQVLVAGMLVMAFLSITGSLAKFVVRSDAQLASTLAFKDGQVLAQLSQQTFVRDPDPSEDSISAQLARRALSEDPTAVRALTVLGFQADVRGERKRAEALFRYSDQLSRRELRPRMWLIQNAVERGDIARTLRYYDIAMRTSREAGTLLFPTLSRALKEPKIRTILLDRIKDDSVWRDTFLRYAAKTGIETEGALALITEAGKRGVKVEPDLRAYLVDALIAEDKTEKAWDYYRSFNANTVKDRSRDPNFEKQFGARSKFDWNVSQDPSLVVEFLREGSGGVLDFSAPPSVGGILVSQYQLLPSGAYRLEGVSSGIDQPERSRPFWMLTCVDGREIGRVPLPNSAERGGRFSGVFVVPNGCPMQILTLVAKPTDDILGLSGQIDRVELEPQ